MWPRLRVLGRRWYSPLNYNTENSRSLARGSKVGRAGRFGRGDWIPPQTTEPIDREIQPEINLPTEIPKDLPKSNQITERNPCLWMLSQPTLVVERRIEYMNLFLGFEQANQYALYDGNGTQIGWIMERDFGIGKAIMRQIYRLHRPFTVDVIDMNGGLLMTIRRPFSWINSHIKSVVVDYDGNETVVGESVQSWHLWRRRYNLFRSDDDGDFVQFGKIDSGFLRWEFPIYNERGEISGSVSRNFGGFFREAFTDTGVYILRMDGMDNIEGGPPSDRPLTLEERAVVLANAVSIDFDYFSRHSGVGGGGFIIGGGSADI